MNFADPVIGFAPPVVAFTTMLELPVGVPGFVGVLPLPELPPHEVVHNAARLSRAIIEMIRMLPSTRLRELTTTTTPSSPGSSIAKKTVCLWSRGLCSLAVGAVVEIVRVTLVALVVMLPVLLALDELKRQLASLGRPEQV